MPKLFQARVVIPDRTIKFLPNNPFTIIPAPEQTQQIIFMGGFAHRIFPNAYAGIQNPAYCNLAYPDNPTSPVITNDIGISTYLVNTGSVTTLKDVLELATVDSTLCVQLLPAGKSDPLGILSPALSSIKNTAGKPVRLDFNNNGINLTGGGSGNQLFITLSYFIYDYGTHLFLE